MRDQTIEIIVGAILCRSPSPAGVAR